MKKTLIISGLVVLVGGLVWGGIYWLGSGIGGGASEQYAPDTVQTGEPAIVTLIVTATGGGGAIKGRYTNISLSYRLIGENSYKTIQPQSIALPDNFQKAQRKGFQSEAYQFTIPAYSKGTTGDIEYYTEMTFDGYPSRQEGIKKIQIISTSSATTNQSSSINYEKKSLSWAYIYGPENGKVKVYLYAPDQITTINQAPWAFALEGDKIISGNYTLVVDPSTEVDGLGGGWSATQTDVGQLQFNATRSLTDGQLRSIQLDQNGYQDAVTFYQYGSSDTDVIYIYRYFSEKLSLVHFVSNTGKSDDFTETGLGGVLTSNQDGTFTSEWYDNSRGYITTKWKYTSSDNNLHEISTSVSQNPPYQNPLTPEEINARKLPRNQCPCWEGGDDGFCAPQSACI